MCACSASTAPSVDPPGSVRQSHLSLRADVGPELLFAEVSMVPSDSLILRATVQGKPEDYGVPVISASDTTALERRNDGTATVRHPGDLILTVTALPKVASASSPLLSGTARLHVMCTAEARPGLALTLQDSATGQPLAGSGSMRLRAISVAYSDSTTAPFLMSSWSTAWERPGTYAVTAGVDAYQPWRRDNVEVSRGICHVRTAHVLARLQRR